MNCKVKKKINLIQSSKISSVDNGMTISRKSNTSYYDTFIEETGKIVKMIKKNHKRLFSEDNSNMRHNQKIQINEINKEFSKQFNLKEINSTTMSNLMKSIERADVPVIKHETTKITAVVIALSVEVQR